MQLRSRIHDAVSGENMKLRSLVMTPLLGVLVLVGSACAGAAHQTREELTLAPASALPDFVRDGSSQVKEAYRFAIANPEVLSVIPCYCGCGAMGHKNNLQCYIKDMQPDGSIVFENHAFG
jgi:hypothetical protein